MNITTRCKRLLADTITPVSVFLRVRDRFQSPVLLESNDYRSVENSNSIIGFEPLAVFGVQNGRLYTGGTHQPVVYHDIGYTENVAAAFHNYIQSFKIANEDPAPPVNGFIGHTNFDAVQYFDTIVFPAVKRKLDIPDIHYVLFRYLININHYRGELFLTENRHENELSRLEQVEDYILHSFIPDYSFGLVGEEWSNLSDQEYMDLVSLGKHHCHIGDVFQIVLSRQFGQRFRGDEFNVYRILRSVNPSPYLFYFDFGGYRIFGSSPESQLVIKNNIARVNPIAGTYRRTGIDDQDAAMALALANDPKENAEHIMLVDLARNDLGRHCTGVTVKELKEIQYFSHVIHLVSKVEGSLTRGTPSFQIFGDTFPAGTLSGAPKYKAIELINQYENQNRSFYGGGIGFIDFNGNINHAIIIRSFLSLDNVLYSQAGAGIVSESKEKSELQEVNNKLGALKKALQLAEEIY